MSIKSFHKTGMIRYILYLLKLVCHKKPSPDSFLKGHNDGHTKTGKPMLSEIEAQDLNTFLAGHPSSVGKKPSIYSEIGGGVYQGESVTFRRWALPGGTGTHPWVFDRLRYQEGGTIQPVIVQKLRC